MVDSTGVRLGFINPGEWSDGLQRIGSNPISTTTFKVLWPSGPRQVTANLYNHRFESDQHLQELRIFSNYDFCNAIS